jgi:hypothetical protein
MVLIRAHCADRLCGRSPEGRLPVVLRLLNTTGDHEGVDQQALPAGVYGSHCLTPISHRFRVWFLQKQWRRSSIGIGLPFERVSDHVRRSPSSVHPEKRPQSLNWIRDESRTGVNISAFQVSLEERALGADIYCRLIRLQVAADVDRDRVREVGTPVCDSYQRDAHHQFFEDYETIDISAFAVVAVLLRAFPPNLGVDNALSFKAFGLEFSGPSGPITLWLICFLGLVVALKLLRAP